jgi:hypothetical protein
MPINFKRCKKHGIVHHTTVEKCDLCIEESIAEVDTETTELSQICQVVDEQLNHLIRNNYLTRTQCSEVRDKFVAIIAGKLHHA